MEISQLAEQLRRFSPWNEQEARDQSELLRRLDSGEALLTRDNPSAHLTASAWVVNPRRDRVLMAYHNLYGSWAWLGGHADGDADLAAVALREVQEESGAEPVRLVCPDIFSVEILGVNGHEKRGRYVSSHLHLNLTYLIEADDTRPVRCKPDENSQVDWFTLDEAVRASTESWYQERIYRKLNEKLRAWTSAHP